MIFDRLENLYRYDSLHPAIANIRKLLGGKSFEEDGQFEGPVKYSVSTYRTTNEKDFEWHRLNADLQVVLKGRERCQYSSAEADMENEAFQSGDIAFCQAEAEEELILSPCTFVLYFPGELHRPALNAGAEAEECRKVVFKLPKEGFENEK